MGAPLKIERPAERRIPKKPTVYLRAIDFASVLLGHEAGRVGEADGPRVLGLAHELDRAAHFYHKASLEHARRKIRRGRPQNMADIAFIYAMGIAWKSTFGAPKFRKYQNARITRGERGGKERPTHCFKTCAMRG